MPKFTNGPLEPFFNKTWQLADFELVK